MSVDTATLEVTDLGVPVPRRAQTGYGSGAEPVARFGLGELTQVDVEIRRPRSEAVETLRDVDADLWIRVGAACP